MVFLFLFFEMPIHCFPHCYHFKSIPITCFFFTLLGVFFLFFFTLLVCVGKHSMQQRKEKRDTCHCDCRHIWSGDCYNVVIRIISSLFSTIRTLLSCCRRFYPINCFSAPKLKLPPCQKFQSHLLNILSYPPGSKFQFPVQQQACTRSNWYLFHQNFCLPPSNRNQK